MIIADTSIWIEFFKCNSDIFPLMESMLEDRQILAVECIFGELLQGAKNKREREIIYSYWDNLPKIDEAGVWLKAGKYSGENNLISKGVGLIDSVIIIIARYQETKIWSLDKRLKAIFPNNEKYITS